MKKIDISTKKYPDTFTMVDDRDYEALNAHKWLGFGGRGDTVYAMRSILIGGKSVTLRMHVAIMGRVEGKIVDHRNRNGLDNQRHNLRHCTNAENIRNGRKRVDNTSGYKGVYWHKSAKKWAAQIRYNGKRIHLGFFNCLIKAATQYDMAAVKYHKEFARLNFPDPNSVKAVVKGAVEGVRGL